MRRATNPYGFDPQNRQNRPQPSADVVFFRPQVNHLYALGGPRHFGIPTNGASLSKLSNPHRPRHLREVSEHFQGSDLPRNRYGYSADQVWAIKWAMLAAFLGGAMIGAVIMALVLLLTF